jgi:hypothetical protein
MSKEADELNDLAGGLYVLHSDLSTTSILGKDSAKFAEVLNRLGAVQTKIRAVAQSLIAKEQQEEKEADVGNPE